MTGSSNGLDVRFSFGVGSNFHGTVNTWEAANDFGTVGGTTFWTDTNTVIYLGGVQLELGSAATAFERRSFAAELELCRRYARKSFPLATAPAQNAGLAGAIGYYVNTAGISADGVYVPFDPPMRVAPTMTFYNPSAANALWRNEDDIGDSGAASAVNTSEAGVLVESAQVSTDGTGERCSLHYLAESDL